MPIVVVADSRSRAVENENDEPGLVRRNEPAKSAFVSSSQICSVGCMSWRCRLLLMWLVLLPIPAEFLNACADLVDVSFNPGKGANNIIHAMVIQEGGRITVGGEFTTFDGVPYRGVARLPIPARRKEFASDSSKKVRQLAMSAAKSPGVTRCVCVWRSIGERGP